MFFNHSFIIDNERKQEGGGGQKMLGFSMIRTVFFKFYIVYSFNPTTPLVRAPVTVSQLTYIDSNCV